MDRSYPYSRRLVSRARLRKRMAAVAAGALAGMAVLLSLTWTPDPVAAILPSTSPLPTFAGKLADGEAGGMRRIYPYSVVPGGVSGKTELARVIRTDRVVAAHYASFDVDKARPVVVGKPRAVHVSYRKGDKVYWTARKVMLAEGETLLSDGRNEMRARCANRISDQPQYPVEAHRPAMDELDQPVEVGDGEHHAPGADGLPVSMDAEDGMPGDTGQHVAGGGSNIAAPQATAPADTTLAHSRYSPLSADPGLVNLAGLPTLASSLGSGSRPPAAPPLLESASSASDGGSGPSASPGPSQGPTEPPGPALPAAAPVSLPVPSPGTAPLFPPAKPETEALVPPPDLKPVPPPGGTDKPEPPASVPEPGSIWLLGAAPAALLALRRRNRRSSVSQES